MSTNTNTKRWRVAQVGMSTPTTFDDRMRTFLAHDYGLPDAIENDAIHLPRDFLAETRTYDAVILHTIPHSNHHGTADYLRGKGLLSPLHTIEKWRERLASTRARLIIVWELLPCSLSGWNLDAVDGYRIKHRDTRVTAYVRKEKRP